MRDGGNTAGRQVPVSFFLISLILVALVPHASGDHLNQSAWLTKSEYTENFFLTAGDHITLYSELQAGQYASATVECTDCTITLSTPESNVSDRLSATIYSEVATILTITLETQTTEYIQLNQIIGVSESISSSRPAPDALFLPASVVYCVEQEETCLGSDINSVPQKYPKLRLKSHGISIRYCNLRDSKPFLSANRRGTNTRIWSSLCRLQY